MPWTTTSTGKRVWQRDTGQSAPSTGASTSSTPSTPSSTSTTSSTLPKSDSAKVKAQAATMGEAAAKKQGATQAPGTTYDPYKALQVQKPGEAPTSPFVAGDPDAVPPATPAPDVTGAVPAAGVTDTKTAEEELKPGFDKWEQEHGQLFDMADELKDEKIGSYDQLYDRQIQRLDQLQEMMEEITKQRNAVIAGSAKVQGAEIEAAYAANQESMWIAKERLENTQRKVLAEREKQLARKTVNEENMLAVIGGFGSMAGNKMLIDSIDEGEDKIAWLKTEFSLQDQEHSTKVVQLNNDYKNDKLKIEQWKQERVMQNYESLQSYIENIVKSEDMADVEKVEAINRAKDQYNNTVSRLHKDVIDGRFELSRDIIKRSDQLRKEAEQKILQERKVAREDIETARGDLALLAENYSSQDFGTLSEDVKAKFAELEKASDLPSGFTERAIENLQTQTDIKDKQIRFERDNRGNVTVIAVDKKTGKVVATSRVSGAGMSKNTVEGPQGNMLSKGVFTKDKLLNEPLGSVKIGDSDVTAKASVIKRIKSADEAMKADGLKGLDIRDSFRSNEDQANIGHNHPEATQAGQGESFHEAGQAIDVNNWKEAEPYLRAQGMVNDLDWDLEHFSIGETNKITDTPTGKTEVATAEEPKQLSF